MKLNPCPDCKSSEHVSANQHADSYYACLFWNVACNSKECQQRFWPMNKMPRCTSNFPTKEEAVREWNEGKHRNHDFSTGGRWTGD